MMMPVAQPAPVGGLTAVNDQTLSLPTSGSSTQSRVRGPGMLSSGLARLGERLTRLSRDRIEYQCRRRGTRHPLVQPTGGGVATISTTSATVTPQPVAPQPPQPVAPPQHEAPTATPQGQVPPAKHPHLRSLLFHSDN